MPGIASNVVHARLKKLRRCLERILQKGNPFMFKGKQWQQEALDLTNLFGLGSNPVYQQIEKLNWVSAVRFDLDLERRTESAYAFVRALLDRLQLVEQLATRKRTGRSYKRKSAKQMDRERQMRFVIQKGVKGLEYCRLLDQEGIKPPPTWKDEACPATYTEAYKSGPKWQKRIQDEKSKLSLRGVSNSPNSPRASDSSNA